MPSTCAQTRPLGSGWHEAAQTFSSVFFLCLLTLRFLFLCHMKFPNKCFLDIQNTLLLPAAHASSPLTYCPFAQKPFSSSPDHSDFLSGLLVISNCGGHQKGVNLHGRVLVVVSTEIMAET